MDNHEDNHEDNHVVNHVVNHKDEDTLNEKKSNSNSNSNSKEKKRKEDTPNPKGEWDGVFPKGSKNKTKGDQSKIKVLRHNGMMDRFSKMFNRRETTMWTVSEARDLEMMGDIPEDEIAIIEHYYLNTDCEYKPRSVNSLLSKWGSVLDRVSGLAPNASPRPSSSQIEYVPPPDLTPEQQKENLRLIQAMGEPLDND